MGQGTVFRGPGKKEENLFNFFDVSCSAITCLKLLEMGTMQFE